ncbi:MAG: hypothetical protein ABSA67_11900 [Candidatus Brocadiia bacterium]
MTVSVDFLILGVRSAVFLSLMGIAVACCFLFGVRYAELRRALFDREGMTLLPRGIGRLSARPQHFRWDEVVEVRRMPFGTMRLRLNRPRKFWAFFSQSKNSVVVPQRIWTEPRFAEALRTFVPAERIHAELAFDECLSFPVRYAWVLMLVLFLCAAAAAGCSFVAFRSAGLPRSILDLLILAVAMVLCTDSARPAFRVVAGFLFTFVFLAAFTIIVAFSFPHALKLIAGYWGALAGALIGAAVMVMNGRKSRAGFCAGATFLLAAAGFWCGWAGFPQVAGIRLGAGEVDYRSAWTPNGDGFLLTEDDSSGAVGRPKTVCWYSSDAKLERRSVLPAGASLLAVGREAAFFKAGESHDQLWFVPRRAEPRVINEAPYFINVSTSPDVRHALMADRDRRGKILAWKICDLDTGKVEPVNLPMPVSEVDLIALHDDLTALWLRGSLAMDKGNLKVSRHVPVPESGDFQVPGKPYVVWSWKVNSADSPVKVCAAKTQWLDWRPSDEPGRIRVCRVSENPPARVEYVELDFTQSLPAEATISEEEFVTTWTPRPASSFDGRFAFEIGGGRFAPAWIVDTKAGRKFGMQLQAVILGTVPLWWSPKAHKCLMEIPEVKLTGGRWHWRRGSEGMFDAAMVVYFVDMDRQ